MIPRIRGMFPNHKTYRGGINITIISDKIFPINPPKYNDEITTDHSPLDIGIQGWKNEFSVNVQFWIIDWRGVLIAAAK